MSPNIWRLIILKISSRPFKKWVTNRPPCRIANRYATSSEVRPLRAVASVIAVVAATETVVLLLPDVGTNVPAAAEVGSEDGVSARIFLACCWLVAVISWFRAE